MSDTSLHASDTYLIDYHVHSNVSPDSTAPLSSQIEAALAAGIREIALTDHVEIYPGFHFASPGRREDFEAVAREYFREVRDAARSGFFSCLAHLDLLKRYAIPALGSFDVTRYMDEIHEILEAAIETGTAVEVNTSGLRQAPGEPLPWRPVLERYRALGGELITVGSDAHRPADVGFGIRKTYMELANMGFSGVTAYAQGRPASLLSLQSPGKRL